MSMKIVNPALVQAFRFHMRNSRPACYYAEGYKGRNAWPEKAHGIAREAIARARHDVSQGINRYPQPVRVTYRQEDSGLRLVGRVQSDCGGRNGYWSDDSGWFTDPYGDVFKDGSGLCYGLVYQLSGRNGKARFVAGYQFGGTDGGPTIDFGTVFEENARCYSHWDSVHDYDADRDAARAADSMASNAAEQEREYQTAWQAGSRYADCKAELADIRKSVLQTIADIKGACESLRALPETIRARLKQSLESDIAERSDVFAKMEKLANGDYDNLYFYPDARLKEAFNEGAGQTVLR